MAGKLPRMQPLHGNLLCNALLCGKLAAHAPTGTAAGWPTRMLPAFHTCFAVHPALAILVTPAMGQDPCNLPICK